MKFKLNVFFGFLFLICTACDSTRLYEKNEDFDDYVWEINNVPSFSFQIEDVSRSYNIYMNLRNSLNYPYRNIYVRYYLLSPEGKQISSELINLQLFNAKTGKPFGDGMGGIFDHRQLLLENFHFEIEGEYQIKFEQYMRTEELPMILSVGTRIELAEQK